MRRNLSRRDATYLGFSLLIFLFIAITFVNLFVYPLRASNPNFSDVERVFSKLEFPADWQEIDSSENRGWYGRVCPIEGSGCFSKTTTRKISDDDSIEQAKLVLVTGGCSAVGVVDNTPKGSEKRKYRLECSAPGGINIGSDLDYEDQEIYISVRTY
jgi:hypothetical protein